jgi:hypothetical protein
MAVKFSDCVNLMMFVSKEPLRAIQNSATAPMIMQARAPSGTSAKTKQLDPVPSGFCSPFFAHDTHMGIST